MSKLSIKFGVKMQAEKSKLSACTLNISNANGVAKERAVKCFVLTTACLSLCQQDMFKKRLMNTSP